MELCGYVRKSGTDVKAVRFNQAEFDRILKLEDLPPHVDRVTETLLPPYRHYYMCLTRNGAVRVENGDWIIVGEDESYPCPADVFQARYQAATAVPSAGTSVDVHFMRKRYVITQEGVVFTGPTDGSPPLLTNPVEALRTIIDDLHELRLQHMEFMVDRLVIPE